MPEAQRWALGALVLEAPWLQQMQVASLLLLAQELEPDPLDQWLALVALALEALVLEAQEVEQCLSSSFLTAVAGRGPRSEQGQCSPW